MKNPPSWATIAIATHYPQYDGAPTHVLGFGLLIVSKFSREDWRFEIEADVAARLVGEVGLLRHLADALPHPTYVLGERPDADTFTPLVDAAHRMPPPLNAFLLFRLARLRSALVVDLAPTARRATLPFAAPPIGRPPLAVAVSDGNVVDVAGVRAELEARVLADWCGFLRMPAAARCGTAGVATATWMAARGK